MKTRMAVIYTDDFKDPRHVVIDENVAQPPRPEDPLQNGYTRADFGPNLDDARRQRGWGWARG